MSRPDRQFDWHRLFRAESTASVVADSRPRMRALGVVFAICAAIVMARCVYVQLVSGPEFRRLAIGTRTVRRDLNAPRGRILARDGTAMAEDRPIEVLKLHYRTLERPRNKTWLRRTAQERLPRESRQDPDAIERAKSDVTTELDALHRRLARLCGFSTSQWNQKCLRVQQRVERAAASVNRRHLAAAGFGEATREETEPVDPSWSGRIADALGALFAPPPPLRPARITIREELEYHEITDQIPLDLAEDITAHPERYPGVTLDQPLRRFYPNRSCAAHTLGYLGHEDGVQWTGRSGVERAFEDELHGASGVVVDRRDASGRRIGSAEERPPQSGRDIRLTIDLALQKTAERLLDEALKHRLLYHRRQTDRDERTLPAGGSAVVMDVRTGALLVSASTPRFDPNAFCRGDTIAIERYLSDPNKAMFDRSLAMAVPPGSVFKIITALALLETAELDPDAVWTCRGYLHRPDRQRCALYRKYGIGHGPTTLADALTQSCNVYFFHYAERLGPQALVGVAARFGLGQRTGVAMPGETTGHLPTPRGRVEQQRTPWRLADTQALAIGQGELTTTPLQIARLMAAVANDGWLVQPHFVAARFDERSKSEAQSTREQRAVTTPVRIPKIHSKHLVRVRDAMRRVVADPVGTAHATLFLKDVAIAGKTGTAQTGAGRADHAWFAGYVPAQNPQFAIVVALEHCGSGSQAAGPVVRQLAQRMKELGLLARPVDRPNREP